MNNAPNKNGSGERKTVTDLFFGSALLIALISFIIMLLLMFWSEYSNAT